ncbi:MAG: HAD family hydrolase [Solirubrobacterales bacterium]
MATDRDFTFRAVFLDALGTLVELEAPWRYLRPVVPPEVPEQRLVGAVRAEMAYYKEHAHEGRDSESLAGLRERCAALLSDRLGTEISVSQLLGSLRFRAYPDSAPALARLRERGLKTVVVSNWDCSLPAVLDRVGLGAWLDGAVSSAQAGARKPDPAIFEPALELAGVQPGEVVHVGDTVEEDVAAARAAGIEVLLLDRGGRGDIASLGEIVKHL